MNVSDTFNEQPIKQLIALAIHERDAIRAALRNDRSSLEIKRQIEDWKRKGGWFPCGETRRIYQEFRPRYGPGEFDQIHQEANAEVIRAGLGSYLLPKLEAAYNAHLELLDNILSDFEDNENKSAHLDSENTSLNALISVVNAYVDGNGNSPIVPETETGKESKRRVTASEAMDWGEKYVKDHPWPGLNEATRLCGCSKSTMVKAITDSNIIQRAIARVKFLKLKGRGHTQNVGISKEATIDEALNLLRQFALNDMERATFNDPKCREEMFQQSDTQIHMLVQEQQERYRSQEKAIKN